MFLKKSSVNWVCVFGNFLHDIIIIFLVLWEWKPFYCFLCSEHTKMFDGKICRFSIDLGKGKERSPAAPTQNHTVCTHHGRFSHMPLLTPSWQIFPHAPAHVFRIRTAVSYRDSEVTIKTKSSSAAYRRHHLHDVKRTNSPMGVPSHWYQDANSALAHIYTEV